MPCPYKKRISSRTAAHDLGSLPSPHEIRLNFTRLRKLTKTGGLCQQCLQCILPILVAVVTSR